MEKSKNILDHSTNLMTASFEKLYTEGKNSDVTLLVGNRQFHVHRVILATHSETFQRLLYGKATDLKEITIDAPLVAFECMLMYLYSCKMDLGILGIRDLLETLEVAQRYGLQQLEADMVEYVCGQMESVVNLVSIIKSAVILNSNKMTDKCVYVLNQNSDEFFGSQDFLALNEKEFASVMCHKDLMVASMQRLEAIEEWLRVHQECSKEIQGSLILTIDLTVLTNKQLIDHVRPTKFFDDEILFRIVRSREDQPMEEVPPENELQPNEEVSHPVLPKVIVGSNTEYLTSTTDFALATKMSDRWTFVVDLGATRIFNYLQFNIGTKRHTQLTVNVSTNLLELAEGDLTWIQLRQHFHCRSLQTIYVPETTARYIQITGVKKLNNFKVSNELKLPLLEDYWICLTNSYRTDTFIECLNESNVLSHSFLPDTFKNIGKATPFVECASIFICFNQPYVISKFMIRLWDFDGRTQDFTACAIKGDTDASDHRKDFVNANGWLTIDVEPYAYSGLMIKGKLDLTTNKNTKIRLAHFEAIR